MTTHNCGVEDTDDIHDGNHDFGVDPSHCNKQIHMRQL